MAAGDDDVLDAVRAQPVEHEGDERAVDERHDRLRDRGGERAQPGALAPGQDERLHQTATPATDERSASAGRPTPS